ncbi:hypothetical protein JB92DRAFT_1669279 [Gautieria morchelliformis]|nr:hypothetical protein JB92DRAFT_1669279 [Gautieria morchelliformis]
MGEEHINSDKYPAGPIGHGTASTVFRETNYEFSIDHNVLEDKIQRFASFLSRPVFHKKGIFQQALSVQSEFENHVQDDERRIANLDRYRSRDP